MIIFEGANGTGKTTLARCLSGALGAPAYRAFRPEGSNHHQWDGVGRLREWGVPANTFVDDMYVADMARVISNELILDRSMPSAFAYDAVNESIWIDRLTDWDRRLKQSICPAMIVWLVSQYDIAKERMTGHTPSEQEYHELEDKFAYCMARLSVPIVYVDTSSASIPDVLAVILEERGQICQALSKSEAG